VTFAKPKTYVDGAAMAYRDAAKFVREMGEGLPHELQFFRPQFEIMANGFLEKSKNAELLGMEANDA
jgi:hypothetical protein